MISFYRDSDYLKSPLDLPVRTLETTTLTYDRVSTFHFEFLSHHQSLKVATRYSIRQHEQREVIQGLHRIHPSFQAGPRGSENMVGYRVKREWLETRSCDCNRKASAIH